VREEKEKGMAEHSCIDGESIGRLILEYAFSST